MKHLTNFGLDSVFNNRLLLLGGGGRKGVERQVEFKTAFSPKKKLSEGNPYIRGKLDKDGGNIPFVLSRKKGQRKAFQCECIMNEVLSPGGGGVHTTARGGGGGSRKLGKKQGGEER